MGLREELDLTQEELAEKIGKTLRSIQNYESEKRKPDKTTLLLIAYLFNVSPDWLTEGKDEKMFKGSSSIQEYNPQLIREVIQIIEELFKKKKLYLPPSKKAELVTLLYEELLEDESKKDSLEGKIIKLVKLAS